MSVEFASLPHGRRWTEEEDAVLLSGTPPFDAHLLLGRSIAAIHRRMDRLGLVRHKWTWREPVNAEFVTDLREQQANYWQAWADANPEKRVAHSKARQDRLQAETKEFADRNGEPWTEDDFAQVMRDRPLVETAKLLGRSYEACVQARRRKAKELGIKPVKVKAESDPYDGGDRRVRWEEGK